MQTGTTTQQIRSFIQETFLFGNTPSLGDGDSFLDGGILDSTGVLQLVSFLEETFHIKVEDDEMIPDNLDSITSVASFLFRKQNIGISQEVHQ